MIVCELGGCSRNVFIIYNRKYLQINVSVEKLVSLYKEL